MLQIIFNILQEEIGVKYTGIPIEEILAYLGLVAGAIWTVINVLLSRKFKKTDDKNADLKQEGINTREETKVIILEYKKELAAVKKDFENLSDKYEQLYTDKMAIQIELAVTAYEHELLYNKLIPEDSSWIKKRVGIFKNSMAGVAVREKIERDDRRNSDVERRTEKEKAD